MNTTTVKPTLQFVVVPDAGAARRLRRAIAERGARSGVLVGTWRELLDLAARAYLPVFPDDGWSRRFPAALAEVDGAFWEESLAVAPDETASAVADAYTALLGASGLGDLPAPADVGTMPPRVARRYGDFRRLAVVLDGMLPDELAALRDTLRADASRATHLVRIERAAGFPQLSATQARLVDRLNGDTAAEPDADLVNILQHLAGGDATASDGTALRAVQRQLFGKVSDVASPDATLQAVGCRDFLEEAEIAAGMAQALLDEDPELRPRDIGVLVPDDFGYAVALSDAFGMAGLPLSGLPAERWRRDLGREALLMFLYCRQKPAPAMAIAACMTSPLMPWSREDGAVLAQKVMDGDYRLRPMRGAEHATRDVLALMQGGDDGPPSLRAALASFTELLRAPSGLDAHCVTARAVAAELDEYLADRAALDWGEARRRVTPRYLASDAIADFNLEGVTVWRESQEPWRSVRHVFVLGFAEGHYPAPVSNAPVFSDDELRALDVALGIALPTRAGELGARRNRFRRHLAAANESVSLFVPRRRTDGKRAGLSESHVFVADVLGRAADAESLVLDVDDELQRVQVLNLAAAPAASASPPRAPDLADLDLGSDLLGLRTDDDGVPRPESPSGLESLMVSPLGWLLRRLGAEPLLWQPEVADPATLGTLAHAVFEGLFVAGEPLPGQDGLEQCVAALLDARITDMAPFLRTAQWHVERNNLLGSLTRAAAAWTDMLERLGARILAGEVWLAGKFHDIDIHGQADLILALSDGRVFVVDYKRSSSGRRRDQMRSGYDSQVTLYRTMIETGGPKNDDDALRPQMADAGGIGIVYYLMNDQTALSDAPVDGGGAIAGWEVVDADVSGAAVPLIERRIDQVRAGRIVLNGADDEAHFSKAANVTPYALDVSPLVRLHVRDGLAEGL